MVAGSSSLSESLIEPLRHGEHLTRPEFERRYEASPHIKNAELIDGTVYVTTAVPCKGHAEPHARLMGWLGYYAAFRAEAFVANGATVRLDNENAPQPDAVLMLKSDCGGRARISQDDVLEGPPELVAEVFSKDDSVELMARKRSLYQRHGVREYIVLLPHNNRLDWFVLEEDIYSLPLPDEDGVIRSRIFPGLWLAVEAMLSDDMPQVVAMVQEGLASPEHQAFVQEMTAQS